MRSVELIVLLTMQVLSVNGIDSTKERICYQSSTTSQSYQSSTQYHYTQSYDCGIFDWSRCYRQLSAYRSITLYRPLTFYISVCCSGYSGTLGNCQPICTNCPNTHLCLAPSMCACPANSTENSCTEPPHNVSVTATSSNSLNMTWDPPPTNNINFYIVYFQGKRYRIEATANLELDLNSLTPYTTYNCCVAASTTSGPSRLSCTSQTTLESVPNGPPQSVSVTILSPTAIHVQWDPPLVPNGVIIFYTIYINGTPTRNVTAETGTQNHIVDGFTPHLLVRVSLSASTEVGEGPITHAHTVRTHESVPGAVSDVDVFPVDNHTFNVTWQPPLSPNGVISNYQIIVTNLITSDEYIYVTTPNQYHYTISNDIEPYIRYEVTVIASTTIGPGDPFSVTVYSREGAPENSPPNSTATRTSSTTAIIEWKEINIEKLRGWFVSYEIGYDSTESEKECVIAENSTYNNTVSVEQEMYELSGLDPGLQYCVWVAGRTTAGVGPFSHIFIPWYDNSEFLLEMEKLKCAEWLLEKGEDDIINALKREMSRGMEQFCRCTFPTSHIANGTLSCTEDRLFYEGQLISLNNRDSSQLVEDLEKWIASGPTIIAKGEVLKVVSVPVTKPEDNVTKTNNANANSNADGAQEQPLVPSSFPLVHAIGVAIGVVAIIAVVAVVVIAMVLICKRRKKGSIDISTQPYQTSHHDANPFATTLPQEYEQMKPCGKPMKKIKNKIPVMEMDNVYENPDVLITNVVLQNLSYVNKVVATEGQEDGEEAYSTIKEN